MTGDKLNILFPFLPEPLRKDGCIQKISAGRLLVSEGDMCQNFALIVDGTVRVYKLGENGREVTLFRVGGGESCILSASGILSDAPFPAFAVAETDVEALMISSTQFRRYMNESESWRS